MRKTYTTKRLLGLTAACTAALLVASPAFSQDGPAAPELVEEQELFESDTNDGENKNEVAVGDTGEIELHVKDLEITKVLQLLSIESQRNIIASRSVENATVSADLYGVSFEEALTAILKPNGFGYIEEGNFIYVLTQQEITERENQNRKLATRILRLNYLRADEAAGFVTPMLSDNGTITASGNVVDGIDPGLDNAGSDAYSGPPTLVLRDFEDNVDSIAAVIQELDVQPKQVIIEATILQANLTEANQFGVDFSLFANIGTASPLNTLDALVSGGRQGAINSNVGFDSDSPVKLGFVAGDAAVFVSALDSVTDTTVIATPKVTVLDRNRTSILVGRKIAYLSTTVTETSETQTVEFLEVGTQLNVRPFVSSDGKVRLELRPSVSSATIRSIGGTDAPDEDTVELTTNVIVESGQTIVLGGLFTENTAVERSQVPGLGSVPFIGKAFQGQDDSIDRSEVIFMVKATVDENNMLSNSLGDEATERVNVARLAERKQLLPWSRSKLTSAHLVNARKLYDQAQSLTGPAKDAKMAEARYAVDMALHMNPSMVDALRLKEKITGEAAYVPYEESVVNDTYDTVLDREMQNLGLPALPESKTQPKPEALPIPDAAPAEAKLTETSDTTSDAGETPAQASQPAEAANTVEATEATEVAEATEPAEPTQVAEATEATEVEFIDDAAWLEQATAELLEEQATEVTTDEPAKADAPTTTD